jgi:hypothetical protein
MNTANNTKIIRVLIAASPPSEAIGECFQFVRVFLQALGNRVVDEMPSVLTDSGRPLQQVAWGIYDVTGPIVFATSRHGVAPSVRFMPDGRPQRLIIALHHRYRHGA